MAKKKQSNYLNFGLKIIIIVSIISFLFASFISYYKSDYRYVNFNRYVNKDVKFIRKKMVKDNYFYKYLTSNELMSDSTDDLLKETVLKMYLLESSKLKKVSSDTYNELKNNKIFKSASVAFYITEKDLLNQANKLYKIDIEEFDIKKYKKLQKVSVNYNGKIYFGLNSKDIDKNSYIIGIKSLQKEKDYFILDCYLYGYDSNINESVVNKLKNYIEEGNYSYINNKFLLSKSISVQNKVIKFKETAIDLDFKYQIIGVENKKMLEY